MAPIRSADLAARATASLAAPGSALLEEDGVDEGVGHGFGGNDRSALLRRWWRVRAAPDAVLEWFAARMGEQGWIAAHREVSSALFLRGREQLFVAIRSADRRGVVYEVGYSDQSG